MDIPLRNSRVKNLWMLREPEEDDDLNGDFEIEFDELSDEE